MSLMIDILTSRVFSLPFVSRHASSFLLIFSCTGNNSHCLSEAVRVILSVDQSLKDTVLLSVIPSRNILPSCQLPSLSRQHLELEITWFVLDV